MLHSLHLTPIPLFYPTFSCDETLYYHYTVYSCIETPRSSMFSAKNLAVIAYFYAFIALCWWYILPSIWFCVGKIVSFTYPEFKFATCYSVYEDDVDWNSFSSNSTFVAEADTETIANNFKCVQETGNQEKSTEVTANTSECTQESGDQEKLTGVTTNVSKCVQQLEIQEVSNELILRHNGIVQTAIETVYLWILTYATSLLSALTDSRIIYKNDMMFARTVLIELLSTHQVNRLYVMINYLYSNRSKCRNVSSLAKSLATLTLTSFGFPLDENSIMLLSTALCLSRDLCVYDFILFTLTGKYVAHHNTLYVLDNDNNKVMNGTKLANSTSAIDVLISRCYHGTETVSSLFELISVEPLVFNCPITGYYERFLRTFMNTTKSGTPSLESIDQLKFELAKVNQQYSLLFDALNIFNKHESSTFGVTYDEVILYKSQYDKIKAKISRLLDTTLLCSNFTYAYSHLDRITEAMHSLLIECKQTEDIIHLYENEVLFNQLHELAHISINETQIAFNSIALSHLNANAILQQSEVRQMDILVNRNIKMIKSLSRIFKKYNTFARTNIKESYKNDLEKLTDDCTALVQQYENIERVWSEAKDIQIILKRGMYMLSEMDLSDDHLVNHCSVALEKVQYINNHYFMASYRIINDMLVNSITDEPKVISQQKSPPIPAVALIENPSKMIIGRAIRALREESDTLKNSCVGASITIQKFKDKQQLQSNMVVAHDWLLSFKTDVFTVVLADCLWSPDHISTTIGPRNDNNDDVLSAHRDLFNEFRSTTTYEQIGAYFSRYSGGIMAEKNMNIQHHQKNEQIHREIAKKYNLPATTMKDNHLIDEYIWLLNFDATYNETNGILEFAEKIQQQKEDTLNFIRNIKQHKLKIQQFEQSLTPETTDSDYKMGIIELHKSAVDIYIYEYQSIEWPELEYQVEVKEEFDDYYELLHQEMDKIRKEFIDHCLEFYQRMRE